MMKNEFPKTLMIIHSSLKFFLQNLQELLGQSTVFQQLNIYEMHDCSRLELPDGISNTSLFITLWKVDKNYVTIEVDNYELIGEYLDSLEDQKLFLTEISPLIVNGLKKTEDKKSITYEFPTYDIKSGRILFEKKNLKK